MATATAPAVSRETLEERWRGLVILTSPNAMAGRPHVENSKLWDKLDGALARLVYGLAMNDTQQEAADSIVSNLHQTIRENAIRLVNEAGIADSPS
jgi:hypothetical protein